MKSQKNNMWMKILSVVIAVLIWLFVANTNDPVVTKRFYSIPVKVMNEDALTKRGYAYEILDGEEVNITVKGKSSIYSTGTGGAWHFHYYRRNHSLRKNF